MEEQKLTLREYRLRHSVFLKILSNYDKYSVEWVLLFADYSKLLSDFSKDYPNDKIN